MAVDVSRIKSRLRAKYPKANLSTKRLDEISAKLAKKPEDDADDDAIDAILEDYNDNGAMTFEEIAKADDKIRTLEARKPKTDDDEPKPKDQDDDMPAWAKKLMEKVDGFETSRKAETIAQRFAKDERLKGIPEFMFKGRTPKTEEDFETAVEDLVNDYKPFAERHKLEAFNGEDIPSGADTTGSKKQVKEIDADLAAKIVS